MSVVNRRSLAGSSPSSPHKEAFMSVVNFGSAVAAGIAGSAQAQKQTSATDQASQDAAVHQRQTDSTERAVRSAGVGTTDEESQSSGDRDADGRRAWEWQMKNKSQERSVRDKSIDPTGQTGNSLDLSG